MKVYTYSQARQQLSQVLDTARDEEVVIRRRNGESFSLLYKSEPTSPFDVPPVKTRATTQDILAAVRDSRSRSGEI